MAVPRIEMPEVALLVSSSSRLSRSSVHLGAYLGANLVLGGHVKASIVNLPPAASSSSTDKTLDPFVLSTPVKCVNHRTGKRVDVKDDLIVVNAPVDALASACLIIICVDSEDTPSCLKLIRKTRGLSNHGKEKGEERDSSHHSSKQAVGIISLQKGVKNSSRVADFFEKDRSVTVLEGAVGLEVVQDPLDGCFVCSNSRAKLVMERLSKGKTAMGLGMLDVLESTGIPLLYRHNLSTHTWAITAFSCLAAVNALTGGPLVGDLQCPQTRLLIAAMLRECRLALKAVARDGKWAPDLESCCVLSLVQLERFLCLPTPLFYILRPIVLPLLPDQPSQAQLDLHAGLSTNVACNLREVELLGQSYKSVATPVLSAVLHKIRQVADKGEGVKRHDPVALYSEVGSPQTSQRELALFSAKALSVLVVILALLLLFA